MIIAKDAAANVNGSAALNPNSLAEMNRVAASAAGMPTAIPAITSTTPLFNHHVEHSSPRGTQRQSNTNLVRSPGRSEGHHAVETHKREHGSQHAEHSGQYGAELFLLDSELALVRERVDPEYGKIGFDTQQFVDNARLKCRSALHASDREPDNAAEVCPLPVRDEEFSQLAVALVR